MIKQKKLKRGDKIAIVSLSWGGLRDDTIRTLPYINLDVIRNKLGCTGNFKCDKRNNCRQT